MADKSKVGICVVVSSDNVAKGANASDIVKDAVSLLGGGTAKNAELVVGGGQNVAAIDEAALALEKSLRSAADSL